MATAETETQETPPAAKKEKKEKKSAAEKEEARKALLMLLAIVLTGVLILYFGFNLGIGVIGFVLWVIARATGVGV